MDSKGQIWIVALITAVIALFAFITYYVIFLEPSDDVIDKWGDPSSQPEYSPQKAPEIYCETDSDCSLTHEFQCCPGVSEYPCAPAPPLRDNCIPDMECSCNPAGVCIGRIFSTCASCTNDTKTCPDGSVVGRVLPNCDFEDCPVLCEDDADCQIINGACCLSGVECNNTATLECDEGYEHEVVCVCSSKGECIITEESCRLAQSGEPAPSPPDPLSGTECEGLTGLDEKGQCLTSLAKDEADSEWCQYINSEHWRDSCYYGVGKITKNPADCEGPYYASENCFDYLFDNGYIDDPAECLEVDERGESYRDECIILGSMNSSDVTYCGESSTLEKHKECINRTARHNDDPSLCLALIELDSDSISGEDSTLAAECISSVVSTTVFDSDQCDQHFDHINYNSVCQAAVSGSGAYCSQITSVRLRDWCLDEF